MKISELMKEIIQNANETFERSNHQNDAISIGTHFNGSEWEVWLERPSQNQLDRGEVIGEAVTTVKLWETKTAFYNADHNLKDALMYLQDDIELSFGVWPE